MNYLLQKNNVNTDTPIKPNIGFDPQKHFRFRASFS